MCKYLKHFMRSTLDRGGVLAAGLGCLYLYKKKIIPKVFGPVSYGIISVGTIGVARFLIMSVYAKRCSDEEQMPGNILEGILDQPIVEMKKEEILEKLKEKMVDKQKESEGEKLQNPQSGMPDKDQEKGPETHQPNIKISIVEQYFSGYEECLKNSDADDYETIAIPTEEGFEVVSKHASKMDK